MRPRTRRVVVVVTHPADGQKVSGVHAATDVPDSMKPYLFGGGGGGAMVLFQTHPDRTCAKRVDTTRKRHRVYRKWYRRQV